MSTASSEAFWDTSPQSEESVIASSLEDVRVLVVDDDDDSRDLVGAILAHQGILTRSVRSARAALQALATFRPQVLVSDIAMPEEDGYSLMRRVRALPVEEGGAIPAIALSAFQTDEDRKKALDAGFTLHLGKPVFPAVLLRAVLSLAGLTSELK